jgi:thiol:disulfide interchange protein DsbA
MTISRLLPRLLLTAVLLIPTPLLAQLRFQEGRHYNVVPAPQATGTAPAGKIEVTEVFSYICHGCYDAQGLVEQLKAGLPQDAVFTFVHAGFNQHWPLFQRAHLTAQRLGIAERNHARLFAGVWETFEFPFLDKATGRPRQPAPIMRDFARFYSKGGGVSEADFVKLAASPEIDAAVQRAEGIVKGWQVGSTPTFVVAGRYRIEADMLSTSQDMQALINYLISLERNRLKKPAPAAK